MKPILPEDLVILDSRIQALTRQNLDLAGDFREAVNQSSETWHDNAPFDAVRDQQSIIIAELDRLRAIRRSVIVYRPKKSAKVAIGHKVVLHTASRDIKLMIGGIWVGRETVDDYKLVSSAAPMAIAVLGSKVGSEIDIPSGRATVSVG
jgi:transcription elongation GreA/GreB family factor